ncbi:MFS general substrate transporter [Lentithecium fluviatile CBS 122367]|uniref:MFS general substrate transporter n=1 Tax=Lentithecium fluviatile CBS 122367 TaxID=1168545 RepID=A0A6G1IEJ2_9PLEO|nr:MFS general substrate transporter [Lentithecium fluviatile CBS 122367]
MESSESRENGDERRTLWRYAKKYRKVVWVTFGLASAILLYGYDFVIVGTVSGMPEFQKDFGELHNDEWILPSLWLALWNVSSPLGAMFGAVFGGWFQDRVGRRLSLATGSFLSAVGVAIMFVSYIPTDMEGRRLAFLIGKLVQGAATGTVMAATQTYLSEILPPVLRGSGMAFFPVFTLLGQLTGALVIFGCLNQKRGYVIAFGSQWPFSFIPMIVAYFVPESPTWLIRTRKVDKALVAQARLDPAGTNTKAVVNQIAADIAHEEETTKNTTFAQCFDRRNLRRTLIVLFAMSIPNFFGLPLLAKASYFLQICGMKASLSIIFLILGIILGLLANVASVWMVSKFRRRELTLSTLSLCTLFWGSMGVANCFKGNGVVWWTAASMMLTIITAGVGVWPVSFAVAAEASSLQLRAKTQGLGWTVSAFSTALSGIALPYVFNPDAGNLRGKVGFTYVSSCGVAVVLSWFLLPEMKGRSVGEIDRMFEMGLGGREFGVWRGEERRTGRD